MATSLSDGRLSTNVGTVQVLRAGAGDPVVYLHSAMGEGAGTLFLEDLADEREVVAPVFPGFGESEGIESIDDMDDAVFHLLDVLDRLGLSSPAVVGLSLGGWMAAELAVRYPDRVSRLVLVNPVGLYLPGAEIKELFGRPLRELAQDMFADQSHPMAQMMSQLDTMAASEVDIPFEVLRPLLQSMAATAKLAWDPYLHDPKLAGRLHRVSSPALIVRGAQDTLVPRAHAEAYASGISRAALVEVEGAAHLLPLEKPAELVELVKAHLGA
ncbi:MAG TPA: alpha/beta fold hydrolase [Acidimicrobiales bacterium]|nr:alpha/beta fold hydrolase [Acidimicrobiales bacterium]